MLAVGATGLPRHGMGAIPDQIASTLPEGTVRLGARVVGVDGTGVTLGGGERVEASVVVVATEGPVAHVLRNGGVRDPGSRSAACCWFAAPAVPFAGPVLILDGAASGPAKNVAIVSEVAPSYAPAGRSLIAAAIPGPDALDSTATNATREQLARWFGSTTSDWEHLRTDVIPHGQPLQAPPFNPKQPVALGEGLFVCGDHRDTASIQGAMFSGRRTASAVLQYLRGSTKRSA